MEASHRKVGSRSKEDGVFREPVAVYDRRVVHEAESVTHSVGQEPKMPMTMPGSPEQLAAEIQGIGVEGLPADAKAGPGMLVAQMIGWAVLMVALCAIAGLWLGWTPALVMVGFLVIATMLNPVMWATLARARDRVTIVKIHEDEMKVQSHEAGSPLGGR